MGVSFITLNEDDEDIRLDRWMKIHYPNLPFGQLQKLLRSGQIRLDGKRVKGDSRLQAGLQLRLPPNIASTPENDHQGNHKTNASSSQGKKAKETKAYRLEELRARILYEDDFLAILSKPFGLSVQGGSGLKEHLELYLNSLFPDAKEGVKLVHRLDRDTSGVFVVAKTTKIARDLTALFRSKDVRKFYRALCYGSPERHQGLINAPLKKTGPRGAEIMRVCDSQDKGGKSAKTHYEVIEAVPKGPCYISLSPVTGRTHQLRVHTQYMGCPIIGDPKYQYIPIDHQGKPIAIKERPELPHGMSNKLHLHAIRIVFTHPKTGKLMDFKAPFEPHFLKALKTYELDPQLDFEEKWL